MSAPDAADAPRDRRPPRSRSAGPRTGRAGGSALADGLAGAATGAGADASGAGGAGSEEAWGAALASGSGPPWASATVGAPSRVAETLKM